MYIYLDESGDLGFNFNNKRTPRYFVITILLCNNEDTLSRISRAVKKTLRNKLQSKIKRPKELKGGETTLAIKKYFLASIDYINNWYLYAIIIDKHKIVKNVFPIPTVHRLYNYISRELLKYVSFNNAHDRLVLVIDRSKTKIQQNEFNKYLSNHIESMLPLTVPYHITHEHSHQNYVLQAVDMFCWGIRRFYEYGDDEWYRHYCKKTKIIELDDILGIKKDGP